MKSLKLLLPIVFLCHFVAMAQVGINNTDPKATLDITATNQATPANTDGILIPRIDAFPATNPTADQQGMMVYLTTASGSNAPGFYYWDNASGTWIAVSGAKNTLDQAYDEGGVGAGRTIIADNGAVTINGTDGLVVTGIINSGGVAPSGAGVKMFFNPNKAAFRSGRIEGVGGAPPYEQSWDDGNIGKYSFASGVNTLAQGNASVSMGHYNKSIGYYATSFGAYSFAFGDYSTALGNHGHAEGWSSFAIGSHSSAMGATSAVLGTHSIANGYSSTVVGMYNDPVVAVQNAVSTTIPLFIVGNGDDDTTRSNALSIYKDGKMNINDAYNMPTADGNANDVMATDGLGNVSFVNPNSIFTDTNTQNTLDQAYDEGGPGAGRTINTTDGAVFLNGPDGLYIKGDQAGITIANNQENESGIHFKDSGNTTQYADVIFDNSNSKLNMYVNSATPTLTIDENQRVGIGTDIPTEKLSVAGTANLIEGSYGVALKANGADALWFDGAQFSWGYGGIENYFADKVGIGTNGSPYKFDVRDTKNGDYVAQVYNMSTNTNADGLRIRLGATNPNTANYFVGFYNNTNTQRGRITGNGTGVTYNTTSDRRLKTNIVNIKDALQIINKIQPRKYEFKVNRGVEEFGFIAQELQNVYPQAVSGDPKGDVKTAPMMVDYSRLTPILTAGLKELDKKLKKQQKEIESLIMENEVLKQKLLKLKSLEERIKKLENK